jgi:nitrate/nitrite transporter NarK
MLVLVFALFNMVAPGGITNFLPTYLTEGHGLDLATADLLVAASAIFVLFVEPFCGFISDKIGSRKKIIVVPLGGLIVCSFLIFNPALSIVPLCIVLFCLALCSGGTSVGTYSASPEMAGRPEYSGMAMGVAAVGQNFGLLLGPLVLSNVLVATGDWLSVAYFWLVPAVVVAFVLSLFLKVR